MRIPLLVDVDDDEPATWPPHLKVTRADTFARRQGKVAGHRGKLSNANLTALSCNDPVEWKHGLCGLASPWCPNASIHTCGRLLTAQARLVVAGGGYSPVGVDP